jgi:hypothetical protein
MLARILRLNLALSCLLFPACGPLLDYHDRATGVVGGNTPTGTWKRDFWGDKYFEPRDPSAYDNSSK